MSLRTRNVGGTQLEIEEDVVADRVPLDLDPPVRQLGLLLLGITDDDLRSPTPCEDWTVGDLLDHIVEVTRALAQAAQKLVEAPGTAAPLPPPSASRLPTHWRGRLPVLLEDLATAWRNPAAWAGSAQYGGIAMPAVAAGTEAVNELTMHGWDLARATGQDFATDPRILEALIEFLAQKAGRAVPAIEAGDELMLLEAALVLSGRDPAWRPPRPDVPAQRGLSARSTSAAE
jgi:uncharacterized protein (TIGR03086 family)